MAASFLDRIHAAARRDPDRLAVVHGERSLTYAQLVAEGQRLASRLQQRGVQLDSLVAIAVDPSPEMVIAMLAVLEADGAYVPLPSRSEAWQRYVLDDSSPRLVIAARDREASIVQWGHEVISPSSDESTPDASSNPNNKGLGYVLYDDHSARPVGVAMDSEALASVIEWFLDAFDAASRTIQCSSLSSHKHFTEVFGTLSGGGTLCIVNQVDREDPDRLLEAIERHQATRIHVSFPLLQGIAESAERHDRRPETLREVVTDERVQSTPAVRALLAALTDCRLHIHYGFAETQLALANALPANPSEWPNLPPIGVPVTGIDVAILDGSPSGEGRLFVGGGRLARGYLNGPDLTSARFVEREGKRWFDTGDRVIRRPDGAIELLARGKTLVKYRGHRVDLSELERALIDHQSVREAFAAIRSNGGTDRLIVYVTMANGTRLDESELGKHLTASLPHSVTPSRFVALEFLPLTPHGAVDATALPDPGASRPELSSPFVQPATTDEIFLAGLWEQALEIEPVGALDDFFELGGDSLKAASILERVRRERGSAPLIGEFFRRPVLREVARTMSQPSEAPKVQVRERSEKMETAIAVVGMAGRFPGARNIDELWKNLLAGVDSIRKFTPEEIDPSVPPEIRDDPAYVKARGVLDNPADFDAGFFGWSRRVTEMTDPQQRVFLELCRNALEQAGYAPERCEVPVGVFGGSHNNTYASKILASRPDLLAQHGEFETMILNEKDFVATRVAHALNLRGTALSIHTACSTSLVAVVEAWRALVDGRCDMALAGGVAISFPSATGHMYVEGAIMTPDGHTRPFDAKGGGTLWSDGAGVVVLKRLSDAQADGDTIHAIIVGAASNNDGADKASFTGPSIVGQSHVIAEAQSIGGIDPDTIGYVEAHGTATPLGDPIEIEALTRAFRREKTIDNGSCLIGSIKGNLGHLTAAAGVAGLIKAILALREQVIPPTPHFERPNPALSIENTPFRVCREVTKWVHRAKTPRRAGVSSFGVGGTNAHVVVEEAPTVETSEAPIPSEQVVVVSAKTKTALERACKDLAAWLRANPNANFADVAWTLQVGRTPWRHRRAIIAAAAGEAAELLDGKIPPARHVAADPTGLAFLFPGQGSQYAGMGLGLATTEPVFRDALDRCAEAARPVLGLDLRDVMFATDESAAEVLARTEYAQPGAFAIEFALAETWKSWGIVPTVVAGHSVGEFVAATLAGVFTVEDAVRLVCERGKLMQGMPTGSMLSVALDEKAVLERLPEDLALACVNAPELCVIAGPTDSIEAFRAKAEADAVSCRSLVVSHAFHSAMMDPAVAAFQTIIRDVKLSEPTLPIISTATGNSLSADDATDPDYWARHLRNTVRFAPAIQTLLSRPEGSPVFLEVGPRNVLTSLVRLIASHGGHKANAIASLSLGDKDDELTEPQALMRAIGSLWTTGVEIDWRRFHASSSRKRIPLPTYPFERQTYMVQSPSNGASGSVPVNVTPVAAAAAGAAPVVGPAAAPIAVYAPPSPPPAAPVPRARRETLAAMAAETIADVTGDNVADIDPALTFLELGMDSLILTQAATALKKRFNVAVTFRGMMEEYPDLGALSQRLDAELPADFALPMEHVAVEAAMPAVPVQAPVLAPPAPISTGAPAMTQGPTQTAMPIAPMPVASPTIPLDGSMRSLIAAQLDIMRQQLAVLGGQGVEPQVPVAAAPPMPATPVAVPAPATLPTPVATKPAAKVATSKEAVAADKPKAFGAAARIRLEANTDKTLGEREQAGIAEIIRAYGEKTRRSKEMTQASRAKLADPRAVSGFRPELKEIVYPIVVERSQGCKLHDIDGNEYVDITCGFGSNFLGNGVPEIKAAVIEQLERGYEIGPQHPLAGEVAAMIAEMTGMERVAFCNTGSEAVLGAMRLARNATGRDIVVMFDGDYHGILDEVIVRRGRDGRSLPAASGIPRSAVENIVILDYGAPEALDEIRRLGTDVAAVLIEPVQSRKPGLQPKEFVQKVREITREIGAAMIMDEVITGFRVHPRGAQAVFGVKADIGTYGKVVGGGMPIGVIAGIAKYMDGLDGGFWQYGDSSAPTVGVTYFAGTFVRHPLALAAAKATMRILKQQGPSLQESANKRTDAFVARMNEFLQEAEVPMYLNNFGTLFKILFSQEQEWGELFYIAMRSRGVHVWDHRPCFFTTAHGDEDIAFVERAFKECVNELISYGLLPGKRTVAPTADEPPLPGAFRGRDPDGLPAWYLSDPDRPGKYIKVGSIT